MSGSSTNESVKRPRDDADKDDNPRETKRPSPPPEQKESEEQENEASGSSSGFMAFASTSSPFAKVKGPNLFASSRKSSSASSPWSSGSASPFSSSSLRESSTTQGVFEGFASSSAFASATNSKPPAGALGRSKSPPPKKMTSSATKKSSAFSAYATSGVQGFSVSSGAPGKRARIDDGVEEGKRKRNSVDSGSGVRSDEEGEGSEEREKMSFGERLRAEKDDQGSGGSDDDGKVVLTEQEREYLATVIRCLKLILGYEVHTGEEDEETIYQVRGKLFALSDQNQWRERGTGIIKLNLRRSDGGGARLRECYRFSPCMSN
jgi:Ran-binding protein 3